MQFRDIPIRQKLMTVILLTSGAVLLLTCAAFITYEIVTLHKGMQQGYTTRAEIIAANSTAALAFQNETDAAEVLDALRTDQRVVVACVYDNKGKVFAKYPVNASTALFPVEPGQSGYRQGHLDIFCPVIQGNRTLGTVYLQSNLTDLADHYVAYAWLATAIIATSFLLAYLLSQMLQKQISRPVMELAETALAISSHRDFSVRAQKTGEDELGSLTDAFNQMLGEIQEQDHAIKKLNVGLEQRIRERTIELELITQDVREANLKLQEVDKLKSEFFANVSHELRTPLTLILAPLEALLAGGDLINNKSAQREILETAHNNAVRLLQMVNGLLDFSKVSAKKMEAKREPANILDLTRSIFWDFKGIMKQKNIEVELALDAGHPVVEIDRYLYERIFFNLLSNAVKFTPKDGKISVAMTAIDDKLTLSVTDTGIGISKEDQKNLFEKFHQLEGSATRRFEGTGLGLAMCKEFAQLLGGTVVVKSEEGKGSTFTLTCDAPRTKERPVFVDFTERKRLIPAAPVMVAKPKGNAAVDAPKVLVAEDNPELSNFVSGLLSAFCDVRTAVNGVEALSMVRSWRPDLLLSDVMMPEMDGIRLTKEIKADKEISFIPVVLLTAMTNRESLMAGWEAGADDYLFKPFHPKELEARVKSILSSLEWRRKGEAYRRQRDALEHFTHIASHDLREPLRKIINFVQLFEANQKNLDQESESYLRSISKAALRMYRLLDVLMEYSRLDRENSHFETSNIDELVKSVELDLEEEIQSSGARITIGAMPELTIMADQIALVFKNLINNSLKYRKDSGIPIIKVDAKRNDIEWVFSVSDNGIGFDPAQSEKIFIMFERLHGTEKYQGDGMGLAICRKIIERHGGKIWAESKPGEGSVFYFTLPLEREKQKV